jgi:hypothetical protein
MNWIDRAERTLGHLAIPHLIRWIGVLNALVFVLYKLDPAFIHWLTLDPAAVRHGEVWRLVSYVLIPNVGGPIYDWLFAALYIYYIWWIGDGLEEAMGSFRLNLFYLLGVIGTTAAAFLSGGTGFSASMLNSTLFFAFARFYPEQVIYFMMILPVKVKWMAWVSAALVLLGFIGGTWDYRLAVLVAFANFLVFFGAEIFRDVATRREVETRRRKFVGAQAAPEETMHRCETCGRTEVTAPDLDFRVAKDGHEYCSEHLPKPIAAS